jgi:hypothetical protein
MANVTVIAVNKRNTAPRNCLNRKGAASREHAVISEQDLRFSIWGHPRFQHRSAAVQSGTRRHIYLRSRAPINAKTIGAKSTFFVIC